MKNNITLFKEIKYFGSWQMIILYGPKGTTLNKKFWGGFPSEKAYNDLINYGMNTSLDNTNAETYSMLLLDTYSLSQE